MATDSTSAARVKTGVLSACGGGVKKEIALGGAFAKKGIKVLMLEMKHTSGTAANSQPRLFDVSSTPANEDIENFFSAAAAVVVATRISLVVDKFCATDANGSFFIDPVPNAGVDNVYDYRVWFETLPNELPSTYN